VNRAGHAQKGEIVRLLVLERDQDLVQLAVDHDRETIFGRGSLGKRGGSVQKRVGAAGDVMGRRQGNKNGRDKEGSRAREEGSHELR
jgi:hypothetical protein